MPPQTLRRKNRSLFIYIAANRTSAGWLGRGRAYRGWGGWSGRRRTGRRGRGAPGRRSGGGAGGNGGAAAGNGGGDRPPQPDRMSAGGAPAYAPALSLRLVAATVRRRNPLCAYPAVPVFSSLFLPILGGTTVCQISRQQIFSDFFFNWIFSDCFNVHVTTCLIFCVEKLHALI